LAVVIFSKSFCPYSRKAKHILLDLYDMSPAPFVVELNEHEMGSDLQQLLGKLTGRRTVPNVLLSGKSIGGGDDIEHLHMSGNLKSKIEGILGSRVQITPKKIESLERET
jgi:glutaredoxin